MSLKVFFAKNLSTSDDATDSLLKPHYYANDYSTIKKKVLEVAQFLKYEVVNINDNYQEILIDYSHSHDIIISVYRTGGYNRVDLKVNINSGLSLGKAKKILVEFYKVLDPRLIKKAN